MTSLPWIFRWFLAIGVVALLLTAVLPLLIGPDWTALVDVVLIICVGLGLGTWLDFKRMDP